MKYDLMLIGPATRDINIDYTGQEVREIGGAVFFCAYAAAAASANLFASVKIHPDDTDVLDAFHLDSDHIAVLPAQCTTLMQNTYFTADRERRKAECLAQSDAITPDQIPDVDCGLYHLAGLLYGDFPNELIPALSKKGKVSADIQMCIRDRLQCTVKPRGSSQSSFICRQPPSGSGLRRVQSAPPEASRHA